ncbi:ciliary microtubule inner protein 1 isoform X2 [Ambystoma mexicanum]|uniref:ciliary microtubule inner protein 1 isoform X2 n=1 Tax=Ambystoma mexicanum TaxID=8296 RepID=UPI0037E8FE14
MAAPKAVPQGSDAVKQCNFVAQDQIWKDHVVIELEAAKKWPTSWGFLSTSYQELTKDASGRKTESDQLKVPEHLKVRTTSPLEKYIKVSPSPAVPKTTMGLIGWRSTVPGLELERYEPVRHVKGNFFKQMNWPAEGVD